MRIGIDYGHGTGADRGAEGYLNEENVVREYGPLVIEGFQKLGHTVFNITPKQAGITLAQSLAYRVNLANSLNLDLVISCHVNAFSTDVAQGCEVEYISASGKAYADKICVEIVKLGFVNRESQSRPNIYILKYTDAVAILVEPFFCDTKSDCDKYDAKKLANAIIKGVTGQDVYVDTPVAVTQPIVIAKYDETIPSGDNILNIPGTTAYAEQPEDGRLIIHKDRGNYISIGKGFIDIFWNDNNGHSGSKRISD